ncbi:2,3-diketo-5-methylthiopentyl-1-phosphate enolase [Paenibacillus lutrae]|uniref:2,3-diketo-5-methylthiopentyl-1-phosphate enolase n=1 Tax=Paenibacillus lutrae TaxID=2078573 RepID=A0A7X3FI21_9BACL|nr:2,3-diketo-5-methylthiopentyl-1-phosphate enolase [Paenibacillus lutrae]MVO99987.1 2,3-diketo-5-methylthiopentyl-1-phosphate enolase [Paenibacillus lutrae]
MASYCLATYRCYDEQADFNKKAQSIAVGLTVGSWTELPEARKAQMKQHLGLVVSVTVYEPGELTPGSGRCADIRIAYPDLNFSRDLPALLVTVFGKLSMDGKIKLTDLSFSAEFLAAFAGPKFGMQGVRDLLGVYDRPLLMSIFKSVIGQDLDGIREQFYGQAAGGVDLVKDDEILFENPLTPIEKRVKVCMEESARASERTGQKLLYATNLTGSTSKLADQAKKAIEAGANALLFNVLAYGFDTLSELSADPDITVPIMAHPAMAGALYPSPEYGISASLLLGKLMRVAGADLVLFPSPYGSVVMPREENLAIKHALLTPDIPRDYLYSPMESTERAHNAQQASTPDNAEQRDTQAGSPALRASFPVPSAGIHPGLVPLILRDFGTDVIVNAGGGIHGHPMGTIAGGQAFRQAIDATLRNETLEEAAKHHPELKAAIEAWGVKS